MPISDLSFTIHHRQHKLCSAAATCVVTLCYISSASSSYDVMTLMRSGPAARRWLEHNGHRKAIPGRRALRSTRLQRRVVLVRVEDHPVLCGLLFLGFRVLRALRV